MHPAPSVIIFTVLSGLGFGYLTWLGLGVPAVTGWTAFFCFAIAFAAAVGGLVSSSFHLGNPQRALKAFTQWKTSWLSREAWASVLALVVMGIYGFCAVFLDKLVAPLGYLGAALSVATVFATAMIYAQLKTVPRWNHWLTPVHLMSLSLAGGAVLALQWNAALVLLVIAGLAQVLHWLLGDRRFAERGHTVESATGLGFIGKVRLFEPPHSGTNYLLKEMVHKVGRKHAHKLRMISLAMLFVVPLAILLLTQASPVWAAIAIGSYLVGTFASRWLFFAEAEHVVGLYYDNR